MLFGPQTREGNKVVLVTALHPDATPARAWPSSVLDVTILCDRNEVCTYRGDQGRRNAQRVLFEGVLNRGGGAMSPLLAALPSSRAVGHELKREEAPDGLPPVPSRVITVDDLWSSGPGQAEAPAVVDMPIGAPARESSPGLLYFRKRIGIVDPQMKDLDGTVQCAHSRRDVDRVRA